MATVSIDNLTQGIIQNFITLMKTNVTSVTIPNPSTSSTDTYTIVRYGSTNPDWENSKKSDYPIIIVDFPKTPEENLTFRDNTITGDIGITIHSSNSLVTTKFFDLIRKTIKNNRSTLEGYGIHSTKISETDNDTAQRNGFQDHWANMLVYFEFDYIDGS